MIRGLAGRQLRKVPKRTLPSWIAGDERRGSPTCCFHATPPFCRSKATRSPSAVATNAFPCAAAADEITVPTLADHSSFPDFGGGEYATPLFRGSPLHIDQ